MRSQERKLQLVVVIGKRPFPMFPGNLVDDITDQQPNVRAAPLLLNKETPASVRYQRNAHLQQLRQLIRKLLLLDTITAAASYWEFGQEIGGKQAIPTWLRRIPVASTFRRAKNPRDMGKYRALSTPRDQCEY